METRATTNGPDRSRQTYEELKQALLDANRALVRAANESRLSQAEEIAPEEARADARARRDAIELSSAAQRFDPPFSAEREARIRELAEAHRLDRLHTPERLERAAQRLLEGGP